MQFQLYQSQRIRSDATEIFLRFWYVKQLSIQQAYGFIELVSPLCGIYASMFQVGIASDNGLLPIGHQVIN